MLSELQINGAKVAQQSGNLVDAYSGATSMFAIDLMSATQSEIQKLVSDQYEIQGRMNGKWFTHAEYRRQAAQEIRRYTYVQLFGVLAAGGGKHFEKQAHAEAVFAIGLTVLFAGIGGYLQAKYRYNRASQGMAQAGYVKKLANGNIDVIKGLYST